MTRTTELDRPAGQRLGPAGWAFLWTVPALLLGIVWVFANPVGAAPDERDHLAKAIAAGRFDIGTEFEGSFGEQPILVRNASIARVVEIPARLAPEGYDCFRFDSNATADCQPDAPASTSDELVEWVTPVGAYLPTMYVPLGWAANLADDPVEAFRFARLASLLLSLGFLVLTIWHLTRWLGRWAGTGVALALTPMAVATGSSVSASGVEIFSATTVAAIAVVATRQPESLADKATLLTLTGAGVALIQSRSVGVVAFALLAVIALLRGGWRVVWRELRRPDPVLLGAGAVLFASAVVMLWWERTFNNPALTGVLWSAEAYQAWLGQLAFQVESAIGLFGWLDAPLPDLVLAVWIGAVVLLTGAAGLLARRADVLTLVGVGGALLLLSYGTYAVVFFPIQAGLQGRHLLSVYTVWPILALVAVGEVARRTGLRRLSFRAVLVVALAVPFVQFAAVYFNGRRYAVGISGELWFLPAARWVPAPGWGFWLAIAAVACVLQAVLLLRGGRWSPPAPPIGPTDGLADPPGSVAGPADDAAGPVHGTSAQP